MTVEMENRVRHIVASYVGSSFDPSPTARIRDDMYADSLDIIELTMELEDEFSIEITDEEMTAAATVRDVYELVKRKVAH